VVGDGGAGVSRWSQVRSLLGGVSGDPQATAEPVGALLAISCARCDRAVQCERRGYARQVFNRRIPVREYLYISTAKMDGLDEGPARSAVRLASLSASIPPLTAQVSSAGADLRPDHLRRIKPLEQRLRAQSRDYRDTDVVPNTWVKFSCEMRWATMHPDSGPDGPDRVAVFTTCFPQPKDETELVLLGSTCHLLDRTGSVGRMGSNSETLFEIAESPLLLTSRSGGLPTDAAESASHLSRIVSTEAPLGQLGRVEGLARVLHTIDSDYFARYVIATPLFVRICQPTSKESRRLAVQRKKFIDKHGVEFKPGRQ
jgi:hypothetical protein